MASLTGKSDRIRDLAFMIRDFISGLDAAIEEAPKKFYIAYKISQNIVCMQLRKHQIALYLKLNPTSVDLPPNGRDVSGIGHYGTGDFELLVQSEQEFEAARLYIRRAYEHVGG